MKAIILGLILIILTGIEMMLVKDATAFVFFAPLGIGLIAMGIRHGDQVLTNEFWERRNTK